MPEVPADAFYTGLVAELYAPLKSTSFNPDRFHGLITHHGEPALELGCGDGDPLLDLRAQGLDVDGLDSSPDMIDRLQQRAAQRGLEVTAWVSTMESMRPQRAYRTIFLAGPTFNLLPNDASMAQALVSIRQALTPDGTAIVPLFVPPPVAATAVGVSTRQETPTGWIGWQIVAVDRDETSSTQTATTRYEREHNGHLERIERNWTLHWIDLARFTATAVEAGLRVIEAPEEVDHQPKDVILQRDFPAHAPDPLTYSEPA